MNLKRFLIMAFVMLTNFVLMPSPARAIEGTVAAEPMIRNGRCILLITGEIGIDNDRDHVIHTVEGDAYLDYVRVDAIAADGRVIFSTNSNRVDPVPVEVGVELRPLHFRYIPPVRSRIPPYDWPAFPLTVTLWDTRSRDDTRPSLVHRVEVLPRDVVQGCFTNIEPWVEFTEEVETGPTCAEAGLYMSYYFTAQTDDLNGNDWIALVTTDGSGLPLDVGFFSAPLFSQIPTGNIAAMNYLYPISARPVTVTMYDIPDPTSIVPVFGPNSREALAFATSGPVMASNTWDPAEELEACAELITDTPRTCGVSTAAERTVTVRVGPGTNRTSIMFLPAGEPFGVMGMGYANDDSVWLRLNKEEVAPNSSANELWVAQDDVMLSGNCIVMELLTAPPLIPIIAAPPANTETSSTGGEGEDTGAPAATISGGIQAGTWLITHFSGSIEGPCRNMGQDGQPVVSYTLRYALEPSTDGASIAATLFFTNASHSFTMNRASGATYTGTLFMSAINSTRTFTWTFTSPASLQGTEVDAVGACVFRNTLTGAAR